MDNTQQRTSFGSLALKTGSGLLVLILGSGLTLHYVQSCERRQAATEEKRAGLIAVERTPSTYFRSNGLGKDQEIVPPSRLAREDPAFVDSQESLTFSLPESYNGKYRAIGVTKDGVHVDVKDMNALIRLENRELTLLPEGGAWRPGVHNVSISIEGLDVETEHVFKIEGTWRFHVTWDIDYSLGDSPLLGTIKPIRNNGAVVYDSVSGALRISPTRVDRTNMHTVQSKGVGLPNDAIAILLEFRIDRWAGDGPLVYLPGNTSVQIGDSAPGLATVKQGPNYLTAVGEEVGHYWRRAAHIRSDEFDARSSRRAIWIVRSTNAISLWANHGEPKLLGKVELPQTRELDQEALGIRSGGSAISIFSIRVFGPGAEAFLPIQIGDALAESDR